MELGTCTYCLRTGRKSSLITFKRDDKNIHAYCPDCINNMIKLAMDEPYNRDKHISWRDSHFVEII